MTSMTLPATLPPISSIESYVSAVNAIPMLTPERETALGRRLKTDNDLTAARDMVLSHLRLVVSVARNYMGYGLPQAGERVVLSARVRADAELRRAQVDALDSALPRLLSPARRAALEGTQANVALVRERLRALAVES